MYFFFIVILLSHNISCNQFCNHDIIQRAIEVQEISIKNTEIKNVRSLSKTKERKPIRINLDFRIDKDIYQCVDPGQTVSWQGTQFTCEKEDIPSESQKNYLKKTMENVQNYLQSILLVDQVESPYSISPNLPYYFSLTDYPSSVANTDIFLSVFIRTYGQSKVLASAHYVTIDNETFRPTQGAIYINSRFLPTEVQDQNSKNTKFFNTLIHEIFHSLGISSELFYRYHPRDSNTPYEEPIVFLNDPKTGKNHKFLVTPNAHKFAVYQWGVEKFTIDGVSVPSGIEIEDGGGSGTAGSHVECRIGNQDLMIGVNIQGDVSPYNRITPLTASILMDTGNYDIVWTKIQPLVWGNKDSIDGNFIKDFVTGPPANVFPQQYIYRPKSDPYFDNCGFTFKMLGGLNMLDISENDPYNCSLNEYKKYASTKAYCGAEDFYNPNKDAQIGGSWPFDFQIVHFPTKEICGAGSACIAGMKSCGAYKVADDRKSFNISIENGVEFECNEKNVGKIVMKIGDYESVDGIKCPPIEQFIRTVKMMEEQEYLTGDPFAEVAPPTEDTNHDKKGLEKGAIIGIAVACAVVVIAIVIIIVIVIIKKRSSRNISDDSLQ